jgi:predicted TIM-barrel fold metal-dependent hydrolase
MKPQLHDAESKDMEFPAEYMFKEVPNRLDEGADPIEITLAEMDRHGVAMGLVGLGGDITRRALKEHPDRFIPSLEVDPNDITGAVRRMRKAHDEYGLKAVTSFPSGLNPQVAVSDRGYYPLYQTCIDLDIPMIINAGIAGPRLKSQCQHVMHFDDVCYDFPELRIIMRHGAEPWEDLAVKLMLKWPGLHYMTSAFAPKYYPKAIVDYANTRGADKVMYAGYYPMGLSLERIFEEMPNVPFRDHVWPKFLRENAVRVLKLDE